MIDWIYEAERNAWALPKCDGSYYDEDGRLIRHEMDRDNRGIVVRPERHERDADVSGVTQL